MAVTFEHRPEDDEFFRRELDSFVPERVFDVHAHLWRRVDWQDAPSDAVSAAPAEITLERYRQCMAWIMPGRYSWISAPARSSSG